MLTRPVYPSVTSSHKNALYHIYSMTKSNANLHLGSMVAKIFAKSAKHPRHLFCGALVTMLARKLRISLSGLTDISSTVGYFYLTRDVIFNQGLLMEADGA
ncbi:unnamed protein product [Linum trigynum]|uniref:Uncharacterized protein n=1 Tax=Linum trigynum TaxID=586398 RepID=A0AAV2EVW5_9ROSI